MQGPNHVFKPFIMSLEKNPKSQISIAAYILLVLQKAYKIFLSPLIGNQCRYLPTCSDYAADCVKMHGAWRGSWMGFARVCRCHPKGGSGYDPAPKVAKNAKWFKPWEYGDWDNRYRSPDEFNNEFKCEELKQEKNDV
jgi:uncharacterized protein